MHGFSCQCGIQTLHTAQSECDLYRLEALQIQGRLEALAHHTQATANQRNLDYQKFIMAKSKASGYGHVEYFGVSSTLAMPSAAGRKSRGSIDSGVMVPVPPPILVDEFDDLAAPFVDVGDSELTSPDVSPRSSVDSVVAAEPSKGVVSPHPALPDTAIRIDFDEAIELPFSQQNNRLIYRYVFIGSDILSSLGEFNRLATLLDQMFFMDPETVKNYCHLFLCFAPTVSHESIFWFFDAIRALPETYQLFERYKAVILSVSAFNQNLEPLLRDARFREWVNGQSNFWIEPESVYVKHAEIKIESLGKRHAVTGALISPYIDPALVTHASAMEQYMNQMEPILASYKRILRYEDSAGGKKQYRNCVSYTEYKQGLKGASLLGFSLDHRSMIYIEKEGGGVSSIGAWLGELAPYVGVIGSHQTAFASWGADQIACYAQVEKERQRKAGRQGGLPSLSMADLATLVSERDFFPIDSREMSASEFKERLVERVRHSPQDSSIRLFFMDVKDVEPKRIWYGEVMKHLGAKEVHLAFSIFIPYFWLMFILKGRTHLSQQCPGFSALVIFLRALPIGSHIEFDLRDPEGFISRPDCQKMHHLVLQLIKYISTDSIVSLLLPPASEFQFDSFSDLFGDTLRTMDPPYGVTTTAQDILAKEGEVGSGRGAGRFGFKLVALNKGKTYRVKRDFRHNSLGLGVPIQVMGKAFSQAAYLIDLWRNPAQYVPFQSFPVPGVGLAIPLPPSHNPISSIPIFSPLPSVGSEEEETQKELASLYKEIEMIEKRLWMIQRGEGVPVSAFSKSMLPFLNIKVSAADWTRLQPAAYGAQYLRGA
jgi:hypothetical protein